VNWGIGEKSAGMKDVDGLLGGDQLALFSSLIDCQRHVLWVKPLQPQP